MKQYSTGYKKDNNSRRVYQGVLKLKLGKFFEPVQKHLKEKNENDPCERSS
jgi:hypothetical protein